LKLYHQRNMKSSEYSSEKIHRISLFSFAALILLLGCFLYLIYFINNAPRDGGIRGGIKEPLRAVLNINDKVFVSTFDSKKLTKTYSKDEAVKTARVNGNVGLSEDFFDPDQWELYVIKNNDDTLTIQLNDIKLLKKTEVIHNFKCIEGWSEVSAWSGVTFSEFMKHYQLNEEMKMKFVGMSTPDEEYYVGIDMLSALHQQTILCYALNDQALPMNQGFPLRLIIPTKYGVKSIKRIGYIYFSNEPPKDYWAEQGYDYYIGL
jgi:DMSO/TMAO reductase YedYZ molybdopterin-dependent catalytic subunit